MEKIDAERNRRIDLYKHVLKQHSKAMLTAQEIRDYRIYSGQQGIFVDKSRTNSIIEGGITVSVLHTGRSYPDDLADDVMLYHYPMTKRKGHDESEIQATKIAAIHEIPVFVIIEREHSLRELRLSLVRDWDDKAKQFLFQFIDLKNLSVPVQKSDFNKSPFQPFTKSLRSTRTSIQIERNPKFRFEVFKKYGASCAICGITANEVLDAAHLIGKSHDGSDDSRNGLVLCATHHRAVDRGIIGIHPSTLQIQVKKPYTLEHLGVKHKTLDYLEERPAFEALTWLWKNCFDIQK